MVGAKDEPLSVTEAVQAAKGQVAQIPTMVVMGEVSGFRGPNARSGHCYFEVKDATASMATIAWRGVYQDFVEAAGAQLRDGLQIQMVGAFDVYQNTGKLSFVAKRITVAGEGLLRQQVAELARKLEREGLMDPARKRRIPAFCTRVCVVTSLSGSVIEDVKRTLRRRNPLVQVDAVGCAVQGKHAPATIIRALGVAAASGPDAILLVRGGGSFEDLMCFNDEALARAVASCPVPVITGIGHEPDTSICDMVSDRRCSTPTAAAESAAPAMNEIETLISQRGVRLGNAMAALIQTDAAAVDALGARAARSMEARLSRLAVFVDSLASRRCLTSPMSTLEDRRRTLDLTGERLHASIPKSLARSRDRVDDEARHLFLAGKGLLRPYQTSVARHAATLDALSPLRVLGRGYALARDAEGHVLSSASQVQVGDSISVLLGEGRLGATVTSAGDAAS